MLANETEWLSPVIIQYNGTIVQYNDTIQYNIVLNGKFLVVGLFELHSFSL